MSNISYRNGQIYETVHPFVDGGWIKFHRSLIQQVVPRIKSLSTLKILLLFLEQTTDKRDRDVDAELSIRLMAEIMDISPTSVQKAVGELLEMDIIRVVVPGTRVSPTIYGLNRDFTLEETVRIEGVPEVGTPAGQGVPEVGTGVYQELVRSKEEEEEEETEDSSPLRSEPPVLSDSPVPETPATPKSTSWWTDWRAAVLSPEPAADLEKRDLHHILDFARKNKKPPSWLDAWVIYDLKEKSPAAADHPRFLAAYLAWLYVRHEKGGQVGRITKTMWSQNFPRLLRETAGYKNPLLEAAGWLYLGIQHTNWTPVPKAEWVMNERARENGVGQSARAHSVLAAPPDPRTTDPRYLSFVRAVTTGNGMQNGYRAVFDTLLARKAEWDEGLSIGSALEAQADTLAPMVLELLEHAS